MLSLAGIIKNIRESIKMLTPAPVTENGDIAEGQNVKIGPKGHLIANDNLKVVMAAGTATEIDAIGTSPVSLKDVFANWQRISCDENGTNQNSTNAEQTTARNCYKYDDATQSIVCPNNSNPFTAFISSEKYAPDYTINYQLKGLDGDDDGLFFLAGYMVDKNGKFHTLTVWRIGDGGETAAADPITDYTQSSHQARLAICYDGYSCNLGRINGIVLARTVSPKKTTWSGNTCICQVTKTADKITAKTADVNSTDLKYTIEFTLPASKPADWTQEQYDNIKHMMQDPSNIGFGTHSNPCSFLIQNQTGSISNIVAFDIDTGKKVTYGSGKKIKEEADESTFAPGTFIYSASTKKLFYVVSRGNVVPIILE